MSAVLRTKVRHDRMKDNAFKQRFFNNTVRQVGRAVALSGLLFGSSAIHVYAESLPNSEVIDFSHAAQDFAAHWVTPSVILLKNAPAKAVLAYSKSASLDEDLKTRQYVALSPVAMSADLKQRYPHLSGFKAFKIELDTKQVKSLLKKQLAVISLNENNTAQQVSYVQHYGVLDALYTSGQNDADELPYGAIYGQAVGKGGDHKETLFRVWAPTAEQVYVYLYDEDKKLITSLPLVEDSNTGAWTVSTRIAPQGTYYRYEVETYHYASKANEKLLVTDPYSLSLSRNSEYSQVVDLSASNTYPKGWEKQMITGIDRPEENVLYEVHIRDFSAADTQLSNPQFAGKYKAFSETESDGARQLKRLKDAGLNTIHLLPTYDISTVNEDPEQTIYPTDTLQKVCTLLPQVSVCASESDKHKTISEILSGYDPLSGDAQALIEEIRPHDAYNWGYDPYHYTVPEGSYALNPEGIPRIVEFREMVQSIHNKGFRVVMDVVYNHTFASGLGEKSVLDKVVPQYYHRLNPITGTVEQSTCCDNTATEHRMMAKLMIDSLVVWARDYKIDGFRFDLMGHQPKAAMLEARQAVRAVDPDTYFYGEGWNFGEVVNNAQFIQASQTELAGTEIGTFTDRLRDAVRGGSSFAFKDAIREGQGIGNGLLTVPNELQNDANHQAMMDEYSVSMDQLRIGLAGNLKAFPLENSQGQKVTGLDIPYGDAGTGYADDPADTINYVSKHDNQTLWDNNQYRIAFEVSTDDRVNMQVLSLAYPLLSQGIPFLHMGSELLRSKSYLRDSFDFNYWFNKVDFSMQSNNYHVGLPPKVKDGDNWELIQRIIKNNEGRDLVSPEHIQRANNMFLELLRIRTSSPLFSLSSKDEIIQRVKFHNTGKKQQQGLIVMSINDETPWQNLDPNFDEILVIFNNGGETKEVKLPSSSYRLHPALVNSANPRLAQLQLGETVVAPALTALVLVR
ncbi:pullulanase-type alpha-1,6-glucosidase [Paraneptunicella aestuarii]|uniref:pullulanase-type alpha-1,6-glucosidase n=1 Tax=Paraneptunicella aestuarii TaxID=2831148 RepID=UPI001E5B27B0|nr:pullulanase-type alpha-1,6-glucosidase [Paraneptunicella aestuarii]UAA40574.1 pullulanase-type alpha-1,6-glucosidase [Paraneptunicella aestuarii]